MVIDTDGSAFITKAEFDSLKNNFQAQIDSYNSSIDSKIDGAIASYLSGIQMASEFPQIIPWSGGNVTFGNIPAFKRTSGARRFFYMPFPVAVNGTFWPLKVQIFGDQFYTDWTDEQRMEWGGDAFARVGIWTSGLEMPGVTSAVPDLNQYLNIFVDKCAAYLGVDTPTATEIKGIPSTTSRKFWRETWLFNTAVTENEGGYQVIHGMGFMDSTFDCTRLDTKPNDTRQLLEINANPFSNQASFIRMPDGQLIPNNHASVADIQPQTNVAQSADPSHYWILPASPSEFKLDFYPDPSSGQWAWKGSWNPCYYHPKYGEPWGSASVWARYTGTDIKGNPKGFWGGGVATYGDPTTYADSSNFLTPVFTASGGKLRIQMWGIYKDKGTALFMPPDDNWSDCSIFNEGELWIRGTDDNSWVDENWPQFEKNVGPHFSVLNNINQDGLLDAALTYRDRLYGDGGKWAGHGPSEKNYPQVPDGLHLGYLPVWSVCPATEDLKKVKDFYAPLYASDTMSQYGKSYLDGACICKTATDGTLMIKLKTTENTTLYLNKNPFETVDGSGNIGFVVNNVAYSAGTGVPVNANESITIVIKDVLAEEKYYIKPEDATTIQFESAVITQDS